MAAVVFAQSFFSEGATWFEGATFLSPFGAAFSLPLDHGVVGDRSRLGSWGIWLGFVAFDTALVAVLVWAMLWLLKVRWRVAG